MRDDGRRKIDITCVDCAGVVCSSVAKYGKVSKPTVKAQLKSNLKEVENKTMLQLGKKQDLQMNKY